LAVAAVAAAIGEAAVALVASEQVLVIQLHQIHLTQLQWALVDLVVTVEHILRLVTPMQEEQTALYLFLRLHQTPQQMSHLLAEGEEQMAIILDHQELLEILV